MASRGRNFPIPGAENFLGFETSGHHVVMFAGMKDGKPQFIGSNNVNPDGSQKITISSMNYPIMSIHQYRG